MSKNLLVFAITSLCFSPFLTQAQTQVRKELVLETSELNVNFSTDSNSLNWTGFTDKSTGKDLIDGGSALFRLDYVDAKGRQNFIFSNGTWDSVVHNATAQSLHLEMQRDGIVQINLDFAVHGSELQSKISVAGLDPEIKITAFHYPYVEISHLGGENDTNHLLLPSKSGKLLSGIMDDGTPFSFSGIYPSGEVPLPFGAYYDGRSGMYFATHDPDNYEKEISVSVIQYPDHRRLLADFAWPMPNDRTTFTLPGTQVLRVLHGDWYDASQIYRTWASAETPEKFNRLPTDLDRYDFSVIGPCNPSANCLGEMRTFQQQLGLPLLFHWYGWHQIPFDKDYPHYFPANPGFQNLVRELESSDVHVMPYINALQWDHTLSDFPPEDAVVNAGGDFIVFPNTTLAQMCPTREHFHQTLSNVTNELFSQNLVSGIYLDQMAAVRPGECRNPAHHHPDRGGNWWTHDGYNRLLSALEKTRPPGAFFTSEWVNEAYVGKIDGMLTNYFVANGQVPLFNAVYNDAVRTFGRYHVQGPDVVKAYRMKIGQSLVYGNQLGWLDTDLIKNKEIVTLSIGLSRLRSRYQAFFNGRMLRPTYVASSLEPVTANWNFYGSNVMVSLPPVLGGRFVNTLGEHITALVNLSEIAVSLSCDTQQGMSYWTNLGTVVTKGVFNSSASISLAPGQALILERDVSTCRVG